MAKSANDNMMTIDFRGCSPHPSPRLRTLVGWVTYVSSRVQRQIPGWGSGLGTKVGYLHYFSLVTMSSLLYPCLKTEIMTDASL